MLILLAAVMSASSKMFCQYQDWCYQKQPPSNDSTLSVCLCICYYSVSLFCSKPVWRAVATTTGTTRQRWPLLGRRLDGENAGGREEESKVCSPVSCEQVTSLAAVGTWPVDASLNESGHLSMVVIHFKVILVAELAEITFQEIFLVMFVLCALLVALSWLKMWSLIGLCFAYIIFLLFVS